ncbi:MAG: redox-regulated ATPase YchF, partial [Candidatus Portiera sp.]|nr:redox-regulated ATPase YchF [Portiera sp.]
MGLKCGLVGLPNVGKSTLFNALTQAEVPAENFAFCTIDPHNGVVPIPDERLQPIASIVKPAKITHNTMEFVDIAGLVEGAATGEGLGNKFLSHIRETDAILHILRCFQGEDINHTMAGINPVRDMDIINTELAISDLEVASKALAKYGRKSDSGDKESRVVSKFFETKIIPHLDQGKALRTLSLTKEELQLINDYGFLTLKPTIYVLNIRDSNNCDLNELKEAIQRDNGLFIEIDIKAEAEIITLSEEEQAEFLKELDIAEPALNRLIR